MYISTEKANLEIRKISDELMRYVHRLKWLKTALEERLNFKMPHFGRGPELQMVKTFENRECQADIRAPTRDAETQTPFLIDEIDLNSFLIIVGDVCPQSL